jgi:ATP-dependent DNA helicase RecG
MKDLNTPIRYLKGVGPQKSEVFAKVGVETVEDLLYYLPFRYEDRSVIVPISEVEQGATVTLKGEVKTARNIRTKSGLHMFQVALDDGTGVIYGVWFHQPYLGRVFKPGLKIILYGKAEKYSKLQINHPQYEILKGDERDAVNVGRIVPVYHLTKDLAQRNLRGIVYKAVTEYAKTARETLPTKLRARNKLVDINFSLRNIHFPSNMENLDRAYRRIVFDEFFLLQLAIAVKKRESQTSRAGIEHKIDKKTAGDFLRNLPFELTAGQRGTIDSIEKDMASSRPMNRLIQGDVGSGKTVVAAYALLLSVSGGYQGAFMAPTEILAEQHYVGLTKMFMDYGLNVALLVQGISQSERARVLEEIKDGGVDIVVGTHALIQQGVEFRGLGIVVIDEQHKFGVSQRAALQSGPKAPDTLLMTATPIPRTLALTVYGDLDVSVIRGLPPGRGEISTYWVSDAHREKVYNFLREEVAKGRQAYVVYPRLEETGDADVKAAKFMYEELSERIFKDLKVELIYGKMESGKKDSVMNRFKKRKIDILVSTVVVEVGIDVPNASVMVIENAERFGLSQLHQLRGRIGRSTHDSYCILLSDAENEIAQKRLSAMTEARDGFEIAEEDLRLRGPGDIFGTRQHGLPDIRFGNIVRDMEIMELARKEAFSMVNEDPRIEQAENKEIKKSLRRRFENRMGLVKVG